MSVYLKTTADLEDVFKKLGFKLVFACKTKEELDAAVDKQIMKEPAFIKMPLFKRYGVMQFIEGVARGTAALCGDEAAGKFEESDVAPRKEEVPETIKKLQPKAEWHRHPNGGGWVSSTAYVEATAYVGVEAAVCGNARVTERARVYGKAVVRGDAECYGACHVHGLAVVEGRAQIRDAARILGKVRVRGSVIVGGKTLARGDVVLDGSREIVNERIVDKRKTSSQAAV